MKDMDISQRVVPLKNCNEKILKTILVQSHYGTNIIHNFIQYIEHL